MSNSQKFRTTVSDEALSLKNSIEVLTGLQGKLLRYFITAFLFLELIVFLKKKIMIMQLLWQGHINQCAHAHIAYRKVGGTRNYGALL